jgi:Domain of unknown function (DUF4365)
MASRFPQRPEAHQLEAESVAFLQAQVPHRWTCDRPEHDYGVDLRLGLARNGQVTGEQLVVQLKASAIAPEGESVSVSLDVPTLNFLRNMLEVAMVVKYVASEQEAYWLLLKDFGTQPREGQKTVTIRIPRANRLSAQPWDRIANHVQAVHFRKLNANVQGTAGEAQGGA